MVEAHSQGLERRDKGVVSCILSFCIVWKQSIGLCNFVLAIGAGVGSIVLCGLHCDFLSVIQKGGNKLQGVVCKECTISLNIKMWLA